jgi:uncharacterized membrane protein YkvI
MPILILVLLAVLIANVGFWDTLQAIFGAIGVIILFWLIVVGLIAAVGAWLYAKAKRKF